MTRPIPRHPSKRVYKFPIESIDDVVTIDAVPAGAEFLCVQMQRGKPCLWAVVDIKKAHTTRRVLVVGTGHPMPLAAGKYLGTFQMNDGGLVFHVFEEGKTK